VDGDVPQINTLLSQPWIAFLKKNKVEIVKFAAACSASQQPDDLMKAFCILHKSAKELDVKYSNLRKVSPPLYLPNLKAFLKAQTTLDTTKISLVTEFFTHVSTILSLSFSSKVISAGWRISGIYPHNAEQIMDQFSGWQDEGMDQEAIMAGIVELIAIAAKMGKVTEKDQDEAKIPPSPFPMDAVEIEKLLEALEGKLEKKSKKLALDDKHPSRQRALWINSEEQVKVIRLKEEQKLAEQAAKAERKAMKGVKKMKAMKGVKKMKPTSAKKPAIKKSTKKAKVTQKRKAEVLQDEEVQVQEPAKKSRFGRDIVAPKK
jgi:hypothetical protein